MAGLWATAQVSPLWSITPPALRVSDVIARIKANIGLPWRQPSVDRVIVGSAATEVHGIVVTMMATQAVLEQAAAARCNMVVTHEPTFYSHSDDVDAVEGDPVYEAKMKFMLDNGMVVFRLHDHWHARTPDGIDAGMRRELGWTQFAVEGGEGLYQFSKAAPLGEFAKQLARRLGSHSMRILGDARLPVRRVAAGWGYAALDADFRRVISRRDVDLVIVGEAREWEVVEYVQDQIESGWSRALIVINHVVSEQAGMKYCADWLRPLVPEVQVRFIATREPFRVL